MAYRYSVHIRAKLLFTKRYSFHMPSVILFIEDSFHFFLTLKTPYAIWEVYLEGCVVDAG